jgi:hypothetical protein
MNCKRASLVVLTIAALCGLISGAGLGDLRAQTSTRGAHAAAMAGTRMQEAESLVQAYAALVTANYDYQGHRAAAAHAVHQALKILHNGIAKNATNTQQTTMNNQIAAIASADKKAGQITMVKEPQAASDAQLKQAQQILTQLQQTMTTNKQQRLLTHVNTAITEIQAALSVR